MSLCIQLALQRDRFSLELDLQLPGRGVTALFGPSGCGKTTLLRCIAGLERASGTITINDELWQDSAQFIPTHLRAIGYVFQEASLFPHLSVRSNLEYGMKRVGPHHKVATDPIIDLLGIRSLLDRKPEGLSGGERQRVAIARALAVDPKLLLMDEPFGALDAQTKLHLQDLLLQLCHESHRTVIFVTHDLAEAVALSDRVIVMSSRPGRIIADLQVPLPRPRSIRELQTNDAFHHMYQQVWRYLESGWAQHEG